MIGLVIINDIDMDEAYEIVVNAWSYRNFEYDDFIEVLDMLEDEEEFGLTGKRTYMESAVIQE